jgi:hypothetical protein
MADAWTGLAQSTSHLPALGMGMIGMRERNEYRDIALGMEKERLGRQEETAKQTALYHQAQLAQKPPIATHLQKFNPDELTMSQKAANVAYGPEGGKAWQPLYETIRPVVEGNPDSTKGDAYQAAISMWPSIRDNMKTSLEKTLSTANLDPIKEKQLREVYNAVVYDETGENVLGNGVFKNTAASMKMEQENSKAAILAEKQAGYDRLTASKESEKEKDRELRLLLAGMRGGGGGGGSGDKEEKKDVKTKISEVNSYIRKTSANRAKWLAAYNKDPESEYGKNAAAEIEKFDAQLSIAEDTLAGLQDGSIDPKSIKSGGAATAKPASSTTLRDDLINKGYSPAEAEAYIAKAKALGKI